MCGHVTESGMYIRSNPMDVKYPKVKQVRKSNNRPRGY